MRDTASDTVAAVCYRQSDGLIEFLLVRSARGRWTIPKGGVERGEASWEAAQREAFEEAGATGSTSRLPLTTVLMDAEPPAPAAHPGVDAFLLRVERRQRPAERHREPTWFASEEAERVLTADRRSAESAEWRRLVREACRAIVDGAAPE